MSIAMAAMVLTLVWAWGGGLIVAAVAFAVGGDATFRFRRGSTASLELLIVTDITAVGAGVLLSGLPDIVVVAPYGYMLTAAVLVLSRSRGWRVAAYIGVWSITILSIDVPIIEAALSAIQEQIVVATGVVIYLGATFVLTSVAAAAVRERNALDQRLRTSRQRLRTVVNGAPVVLFAIDSSGVFTLSEGAGLEAIGLKPGEVVGRTVDDVYASAPHVVELINRTMREDRDLHEVVDLGVALFDVRTTPKRDESGRVVGTMGIATNVTEAVRSRRVLEQKVVVEQLLSSVSGELFALRPKEEPDGIVDALGRVAGYAGCDRAILVAPAAGRVPQLAYSWSRTPGPDDGIVHEDIRLPWFETRLHECGYLSVGRLSDLPIDASEERRFCREADFTSVVAVPLGAERVEGGYLVFATKGWERIWSSDDVVLFRMVGEMLANVLARRRARTQLEDLVESKDRFIASISHELRTPLASVVGLSEELRDRLDDFNIEEQREFHRIVAEQAGELSAIVEDLLVVARIDINQVKVVCEPVSLTQELDFVLAPLGDEDRRHIEIAGNGDVPAWCDRKRVRQVLRNLCDERDPPRRRGHQDRGTPRWRLGRGGCDGQRSGHSRGRTREDLRAL